jgi:hypothetical protein
MIGDGGMATPIGCTGVARDPLTFVKDLDNLVGGADIDEFTDQGIRGGIPMAIDLDVIVGGDAATLPARIELPGVTEDGMSRRNSQRKPGTTRGSLRRSRTAKASRISRQAAKSRCAPEWGGWGRLSDDDPRQNNSVRARTPSVEDYPASMAVHRRLTDPTLCGTFGNTVRCTNDGSKPTCGQRMPGAGLN